MMMKFIRQKIKDITNFLHIYITKNQLYDRHTQLVLNRVLKSNSNCIDVGCHKGEVLDQMISASPEGHHFGFEPIPELYQELKKRYNNTIKVQIANLALSDNSGTVKFNYVVSNPSYSGMRKRDYDRQDEKDTEIEVRTECLDHFLPDDYRVDLMKIDVEGAEYLVLKGAKSIIERDKPIIIFEFGLGAANHYEVQPADVFKYFEELGMSINTLGRFLASETPFSLKAFHHQYVDRVNYYFIAYP